MRRLAAVIATTTLAFGVALAGEPEVRVLRVDADCDGKPDQVFLSQDDRAASVRVVFGEVKRRPAQFRFEASRSSQDAVCTMPVHVESESLDYDPSKEGVGELPGFRRSKTCSAFALVDGECDSIHFYWNHKARRLQWWRR